MNPRAEEHASRLITLVSLQPSEDLWRKTSVLHRQSEWDLLRLSGFVRKDVEGLVSERVFPDQIWPKSVILTNNHVCEDTTLWINGLFVDIIRAGNLTEYSRNTLKEIITKAILEQRKKAGFLD